MKSNINKLILIPVILLICINSYGQAKGKHKTVKKTDACQVCDVKMVISTEDSIKANSLSKSQLYCFLKGFNSICVRNDEYSARSNMVLYYVAKGYPEEFVDVLLNHKELKTNYIYSELSNLLIINDMEEIMQKYKPQQGDDQKKKMIKANISQSLKKSLTK
ncbi:MAG: hypothetical protein Q8880_03280 [Bacteroidota bacterium]|nr:hypothetical protein [Bacteroidota bacterium]